MVEIKYVQKDIRVHLRVQLYNAHKFYKQLTLWDPGAVISVFNHTDLRRLGLPVLSSPKSSYTGFGGTVIESYLVTIPKMTIGDITLTNIVVSTPVNHNIPVTSVLGMNIIGMFNTHLCTNIKTITLDQVYYSSQDYVKSCDNVSDEILSLCVPQSQDSFEK